MIYLWVLIGAGFLVGGSMMKQASGGETTRGGGDSADTPPPASVDPFTRWDSLFKKYAAASGLTSWKVIKAICMNESNLGQAASVKRGLATPTDIEGSKSSDGKSWGLMQMTVTTASDYDVNATAEKLNDPDYSVRLACRFVATLTKAFPTVDKRYLEWVIKSYNQGAGNTKKERAGAAGFADTYWQRFQSNYKQVLQKQGPEES